MTNEPKTTQEGPSNPFDFSCCGAMAAMPEKRVAQERDGCDCAGMKARKQAMFGGTKSETAAPEEPDTPDTVV